MHRNIEELLATTKRIRATLPGGHPPDRLPENIIWQHVQGREWLVTVSDFTLEKVQQIQAQEGVDHVEVIDLSLEDLFKDFGRGRKAMS